MQNNRLVMVAAAVVILAGIVWAVFFHRDGAKAVESSTGEASAPQLFEEAGRLDADGQKVQAKELYAKIVEEHPDYDKVAEVQDKLGRLNLDIITSNTQTSQSIQHEVVPGDSLGKLAKQYNTTKELIKKSNGLKSDVIRVGQTLRIWNAPFSVLVSKSQNTLTLKDGGEIVKIYRVSTGANNITPVGTFKIATKLVHPVWFKPGGPPVAPESPDNLLGTRWMGFAEDPHYGIHGTIEPDKIGTQVTAGCVRMRNNEVEELFDLLPVGAQVVIQN